MAGQDGRQQATGVAGAGASLAVPLHVRCRERRRTLGISQQELADKAGVKQSAVSTFERHGNEARVLSAENIRLLADALEISVGEGELAVQPSASRLVLFYCPDSDCPGAVAYAVGSRTVFRPRFVRAEAAQRLFCPDCGEVCEQRCPGCRAPVSERLRGAFCPECGSPFITGGELDEQGFARRSAVRAALAESGSAAEYRHVRERQAGAE
jgi:transcriptional regulator with XRE-family HTH domain